MSDLIPMGRGGHVDEISAAIAWLCSEESSYTTGALLDVSGGRRVSDAPNHGQRRLSSSIRAAVWR